MNFYKKSIFYSCLIISFFTANINARQFEVFVKNNDILTLDNKPAIEYQIINIEGQYPDAIDIPTYGQIRKSIAEALNLDPYWKNFAIKYVNTKTGKNYFLKPHIEKLTRKERAAFFNKMAQEGYINMPIIIIEKRTTTNMQKDKQYIPTTTYETQVMTPETEDMGIQIVPETETTNIRLTPYIKTRDEEKIIPDWLFDETLVGESDPMLVEQLKLIKQKYE